jgi:hypothetical protein
MSAKVIGVLKGGEKKKKMKENGRGQRKKKGNVEVRRVK